MFILSTETRSSVLIFIRFFSPPDKAGSNTTHQTDPSEAVGSMYECHELFFSEVMLRNAKNNNKKKHMIDLPVFPHACEHNRKVQHFEA